MRPEPAERILIASSFWSEPLVGCPDSNRSVAWSQGLPISAHCYFFDFLYIRPVNRLTKQEQMVLCIVLGLLLTGWAVKAYRTAHPPAVPAGAVTPAASTEQAEN